MASPISSKSLSCVLYAFLLVLLLGPFCFMKKFKAVEGTKPRFHTLKFISLSRSDLCNKSPKDLDKGSSFMEVVHKYGPCSRHKASRAPSLNEILRRDKLRVESIIQARRSMNSSHGVSEQMTKLRVPFHGLSKETASDYIVSVGLGTPKQELPLIFDTGSGPIWTQCKPCHTCFRNAPLFDPTKSSSYRIVSCSSKLCRLLHESCSSSKCAYSARYVDNATSVGFYAWETLTLKSSDKHKVLMGCGAVVVGESEGESGIIGLDPTPLSFPSQTAKKYNNRFSYCLPSSPASTGYLTFGGNLSKTLKFARRTRTPHSYDIHMTGISIGGRKPLTDASRFKIPNLLIDSGTVITRLSDKAYLALRSIFRGMMKDYNPVLDFDVLDTCYNFSRHRSVTIPAISLFFKGGVELDLDVSGIMVEVPEHPKVYCLGFAAYPYGSSDDQTAILGNTQQKTYGIVFDNRKRRIGFASGGCN